MRINDTFLCFWITGIWGKQERVFRKTQNLKKRKKAKTLHSFHIYRYRKHKTYPNF